MEDKKVIWITGASTGIGKALALKFAKNDWIVAASARRENLLLELNKNHKILEIGTGSGYQTSVLSLLSIKAPHRLAS